MFHFSSRSLAAGAEAQHQIALVFAGLRVGLGVALLAGIGDAEDAAGEDVGLSRGPVIVSGDVGGHLEVAALALVVGGSSHYVRVRNGVGLDGVELEVGRGGMKIFAPRHRALRARRRGRRRGQHGSGSNAADKNAKKEKYFVRRCIDFLILFDARIGRRGIRETELTVRPDLPGKISLGVVAVSQRSTKTSSPVTGSMALRSAFFTSLVGAPGGNVHIRSLHGDDDAAAAADNLDRMRTAATTTAWRRSPTGAG